MAKDGSILPRKNSTIPDLPGRRELPIVDILESEHVWAIVDTACNVSCHGIGWRKNADKKLSVMGFTTWEKSKSQSTFGGLAGDNTASVVAKRMIPIFVKLKNGVSIYSSLLSCELNCDANLLFGLDMQRALKIRFDPVLNRLERLTPVKGVQKWLDVPCAQCPSGLPCVRIDHLDAFYNLMDKYEETMAGKNSRCLTCTTLCPGEQFSEDDSALLVHEDCPDAYKPACHRDLAKGSKGSKESRANPTHPVDSSSQ